MTLAEMTEKLRATAKVNPGGSSTLKIDMGDDGVLRLMGDKVDNENGPTDCTVIVAKSDFEQIIKGDLDPSSAFFDGRLRVDGDLGVAMGLQSVLAKAFG